MRTTDPRDIQACFNKVVATFKGMSEEERSAQVRHLVHEVKQEDLDHVVEAFGSDLRDFKPNKDPKEGCTCANCPARKEVENYNTFYNNFLTLSAELRSPKASINPANSVAYVNQLMSSASFLAQSPALSSRSPPTQTVPTAVGSSGGISPPHSLSPQMTSFLNQVVRIQQQQLILQQQQQMAQQQQVHPSATQPPILPQTVTLQQVAPQSLSPPQLPTPTSLSPPSLSPPSTSLLDQLASSPQPLSLPQQPLVPTHPPLSPPKESCEIPAPHTTDALELEVLAEVPKW